MKSNNQKILRQKISSLQQQLENAERECESAAALRSSKSPNAQRESIEKFLGAISAKKQLQQQLRIAKRLLAHGQGDEYQFAPP